MIGRAILNAKKSALFDKVIVSTDSIKIKEISIEFGADWLNEQGIKLSEVCCIYPATPFLTPEDLSAGLHQLNEKLVDFTLAATTYGHPIQRALKIDKDGCLIMNDPKMSNIRSQDLIEAYHDAGQFYWAHFNTWMKEESILNCQLAGIKLPRHRAIDIDNWDDWILAEHIFKGLNSGIWMN